MTLDRPPAKRNKRLDLLPPCKLASRGACRTFLQVTQATGRKPPPQVIAACTPRPSALTVELLKGQLGASEQAIFTRAPGHENRANLPPSYSQTILSSYEGTRLGRQEIEGELLEEVPGTLWNCDMLDHCCIERAPDPGPGSSSDSSRSECSL